MSVESVLLPVFAEIVLIFVLMILMGRVRLAALNAGEARLQDVALGQPNWPERAIKAANAFNNQFQLPVLFFVLVGFALATRKADLLFVVMSWIFVLLRYAHAFIHAGANDVKLRFYLYLAGALVLMAMWALFALRILAGI
jgi:hypothetical protein